MAGMSYKYKIYTLLAVIAVVALVFFLFIYSWMDGKNQALADAVAIKNQEYAEVLAEQQSYEFGQKDLTALAEKPLQPDDLFSQDTKVVKEIKTLETLAQTLGLEFTLQIAGTIQTAVKLPKASGQLYLVPYTVTVEGPFDKLVNYIETAENLNFVTQTKNLVIGAGESGRVRATLTSEFYIKP
jgi:hypothetical protein